MIILFKPSDSLATLAVVAGIFVLVQAIMELMASFSRAPQTLGLVAVAGVLIAIVGIPLFRHRIAGVAAITLFIGVPKMLAAALIATARGVFAAAQSG